MLYRVRHADAVAKALDEVLARVDAFGRLGALHGEGGERALRGWLVTRLLMQELGWPWWAVVNGESLDILLVDWSDRAVIYIETKTPGEPLRPKYRKEVAGRLDRWPSLAYAVLTNGREWERYDDWATPLRAASSFKTGQVPSKLVEVLAPLEARHHMPVP